MDDCKRYLLDRLQEPSTWRGFALLLAAAGVSMTPELENALVAAGLGLSGLIGVLTRDR